MSNPGAGEIRDASGAGPGNQVYVLVPQSRPPTEVAQFDFASVVGLLWRGKWLIVASAILLAAAGASYALLAEQRFRAEVSLLPAESRSGASLPGALSQLGGLANLAGINIGPGNRAEPLAVLRSRELATAFIEANGLLTVLFAEDWDASSKQWRKSGDDVPDIRDAVEQFDKSVRRVVEDRKSGLIKVAVEWKDPEVAASWANGYVQLLNLQMRDRALRESEQNMKYLRSQLDDATQLSLQQATSRLLQIELEKSMVARGSEDYAYRVVDKAVPPKKRVWPRRTVIVILAGMLGGVLGAGFVLFRGATTIGREPRG